MVLQAGQSFAVRPSHRLEMKVIEDPRRFVELAPELEDLCAAVAREGGGSPPFQAAAWLVSWCRHLCRGSLAALSVFDGGLLVGLAPWLVDPKGDERTLAFMAGGISDYHDVILRPGWEDLALTAVFAHLEAQPDAFEAIDWEQLPPSSPLLRWCRDGRHRRSRSRFGLEPQEPNLRVSGVVDPRVAAVPG